MKLLKLDTLPRAFWNLSAIEFLYWFAAATGSYFTIYLQKNGFQPREVGFLLAANSMVSIIAAPFWGMAADRTRSAGRIFVLCMTAGTLFWALIPASLRIAPGSLSIVYPVLLLGCFFRSPTGSLLDAFVVERADLEQVAFGSVRLWGSFSFAVMSISLSAILPRIGVGVTFYLYGFMFTPLFVIMWKMKNIDSRGKAGRIPLKNIGLRRLFRNYYFITFLFFVFFLQLLLGTSMTFLPYLIFSLGDDTARFGLVTGYKVLMEIPALVLIPRLRRKFPLAAAIGGAVFIFAIEVFLYTRAKSLAQIVRIQIIGGLGSGLWIGAVIRYVYSLAPKGLNSTALTTYSAVSAVSVIIGSLLGGTLIGNIGIVSFYRVICGLLVFALLFLYGSLRAGVKVLNKPLPFLRND